MSSPTFDEVARAILHSRKWDDDLTEALDSLRLPDPDDAPELYATWENKGAHGTLTSGKPKYLWYSPETGQTRIQGAEPGTGKRGQGPQGETQGGVGGKQDEKAQAKAGAQQQPTQPQKPQSDAPDAGEQWKATMGEVARRATQTLKTIDKAQVNESVVREMALLINELTLDDTRQMAKELGLPDKHGKAPRGRIAKAILDHVVFTQTGFDPKKDKHLAAPDLAKEKKTAAAVVSRGREILQSFSSGQLKPELAREQFANTVTLVALDQLKRENPTLVDSLMKGSSTTAPTTVAPPESPAPTPPQEPSAPADRTPMTREQAIAEYEKSLDQLSKDRDHATLRRAAQALGVKLDASASADDFIEAIDDKLQAEKVAAPQASVTPPTPAAPKPMARPEEVKSDIVESVADWLEENPAVEMAPISKMRAAVKAKYGEEAGGEAFDDMILEMWREGKLELTNISNPDRTDPDIVSGAIEGNGGKIGYVQFKQGYNPDRKPKQEFAGSKDEIKSHVLDSAKNLAMTEHSGDKLVPIWKLRDEVRKKYGDEAAKHSVFDDLVMSLYRDGKAHPIAISDRSKASRGQLDNSIKGQGNTLFYLDFNQDEATPAGSGNPADPTSNSTATVAPTSRKQATGSPPTTGDSIAAKKEMTRSRVDLPGGKSLPRKAIDAYDAAVLVDYEGYGGSEGDVSGSELVSIADMAAAMGVTAEQALEAARRDSRLELVAGDGVWKVKPKEPGATPKPMADQGEMKRIGSDLTASIATLAKTPNVKRNDAGNPLIPIWDLRKNVASPDRASFDESLKQLWRDKKIRLVSSFDMRKHSAEEFHGMMPGRGERLAYVEIIEPGQATSETSGTVDQPQVGGAPAQPPATPAKPSPMTREQAIDEYEKSLDQLKKDRDPATLRRAAEALGVNVESGDGSAEDIIEAIADHRDASASLAQPANLRESVKSLLEEAGKVAPGSKRKNFVDRVWEAEEAMGNLPKQSLKDIAADFGINTRKKSNLDVAREVASKIIARHDEAAKGIGNAPAQPVDAQKPPVTPKPLSVESVGQTMKEMLKEKYKPSTNSEGERGAIPLWDLRKQVAEKFGPEAASPGNFDKFLRQMRRDGHIRLIASENADDQEKSGGIPGEGETFVFAEPNEEFYQSLPEIHTARPKELTDQSVGEIISDMIGSKYQTGTVPIWELRRAIAATLGSAAASHEHLDAVLHQLRQQGKVRLVAVADRGALTPKQLNDGVPGEAETFVNVELQPEFLEELKGDTATPNQSPKPPNVVSSPTPSQTPVGDNSPSHLETPVASPVGMTKPAPAPTASPTQGNGVVANIIASLKPGVSESVSDLRARSGMSKKDFDKAMLDAADGEGDFFLVRHDHPGALSQEQLDKMIADGKGNFFFEAGKRNDAAPPAPTRPQPEIVATKTTGSSSVTRKSGSVKANTAKFDAEAEEQKIFAKASDLYDKAKEHGRINALWQEVASKTGRPLEELQAIQGEGAQLEAIREYLRGGKPKATVQPEKAAEATAKTDATSKKRGNLDNLLSGKAELPVEPIDRTELSREDLDDARSILNDAVERGREDQLWERVGKPAGISVSALKALSPDEKATIIADSVAGNDIVLPGTDKSAKPGVIAEEDRLDREDAENMVERIKLGRVPIDAELLARVADGLGMPADSFEGNETKEQVAAAVQKHLNQSAPAATPQSGAKPKTPSKPTVTKDESERRPPRNVKFSPDSVSQIKEFGEASKDFFGREVDSSLFAGAVNGLDDSEVVFSYTPGGQLTASVKSRNADYEAIRQFTKDRRGKVTVENVSFRMPRHARNQGQGAKLFADQVRSLRSMGVDTIETLAAGNFREAVTGSHNGYITWPKLGYDGTIPRHILSKLPKELKAKMGNRRNVQSLLALPGGEEAWELYGGSFAATFDTREGSPSVKKLEEYMARRAVSSVREPKAHQLGEDTEQRLAARKAQLESRLKQKMSSLAGTTAQPTSSQQKNANPVVDGTTQKVNALKERAISPDSTLEEIEKSIAELKLDKMPKEDLLAIARQLSRNVNSKTSAKKLVETIEDVVLETKNMVLGGPG